MTAEAIVTAEHLKHISLERYKGVTSSMAQLVLAKAATAAKQQEVKP